MRLTKFNPETGQYEYKEPAKTQAEFNAQRKAVIQRLGELEDKASDLAEEIFAEIEKALDNSVETEHFKGSWFNLNKFMQRLAELKKKYIGKDTNVTTKESENNNE